MPNTHGAASSRLALALVPAVASAATYATRTPRKFLFLLDPSRLLELLDSPRLLAKGVEEAIRVVQELQRSGVLHQLAPL